MRRHLAVLLAIVTLAASTGCWEQPNSTTGKKTVIDSKNKPVPGLLRTPLLTNPPDLDPILISDTTSNGVASRIFNTLVGYDAELNMIPELAESLPEITGSGTVYTFKLRKGVKFQNGREMKAEDVRYSLSRLALTESKRFNVIERIMGAKAAAESARQGNPLQLDGVRVLNDYEVQIILSEPYSPFLFRLAMTNAAIVPKEAVEAAAGNFSRQPMGTGPFRLVEWKENTSLLLERFDDYFRGKPKLEAIEMRVIPESLVRQQEYEAGNLDICDVTSGMDSKWRNSNHSHDVLEWPQLAIYYYGFNLEKDGSPYKGRTDEQARKLRLALNYAVDREHLCKNVLEDRYYPANGIIPRGMPGHNAARPAFKQDVEKAKELLAEAGYPNGEGLPAVQLLFNPQGDHTLIAQTVQQDLRKIGVQIELKQLDWGAFIKAADAGEPAFFRLGWVADYPDPENFLSFLFHSSNKGPRGNVTFFDNPVVDSLLDESDKETDPKLRLSMLQRAEEAIIADTPWLFLAFNKEVILRKPHVKNLHPTGMDDDVNLSHVSWHEVAVEEIQP